MPAQEVLDKLWGGIVTGCRMDMTQRALTMSVDVLDQGRRSSYTVQFSGITSLTLSSESEVPWDYVELTSICSTRTGDGKLKVGLEFWADAAEAEIICRTLAVDGEHL